MKSFPKTAFFLAALAFAGTTGILSAKVLSYEIHQDGIASVESVVSGKSADLVVLDAGYAKNFSTGTTCVVQRNGVPVAEIVIAGTTADCAVALITNLTEKETVLAGDSVKLKTITF